MPDNVCRYAKIVVSALYSVQLLSVSRKHLVIVQFYLCFSLVTINRQTSYGYGILRQDYGITRGFIGKPRMTPISSVKTTDSYEVCR